jgi:multidrug efflux pump subunit AcrA (membrane-fusion protein)
MTPRRGAIKLAHIVELAVLVAVIAVTGYVVKKYKQPGQMSVLEAQGMDMSVMKPPQGVAPVATEVIHPGPIEGAVTYSGQIVAFTDEDVYPRVTGRIVSLPVYPGDHVRPGQTVIRLDSAELGSKTQEAYHGRQKARQAVTTSQADYAQALAASRQAQAEMAAAKGALEEARHDVNSASGALKQSKAEVESAQRSAKAAQQEQRTADEDRAAAEADIEAAQAALPEAQAALTSAKADLDYWEAEYKREQTLLKQGVISQEEFDSEKSKYIASKSTVDQANAKVAQVQAVVKSAKAKARGAEARVASAAARFDQAQSEIAVANAKIDQSDAALAASQERVRQRQADVDRARAAVTGAEASVRSADSRTRESSSDAAQASQLLTTADIVRGYTDIRATVNGVVAARLVSPGVLVQPGTAVLKISQIDSVRLQANVSQDDLRGIRAGAPIVARDASKRVIAQARVTSVFPAADPTARTSIIEALVPNPGYKLLPGQYVSLEIGRGRSDSALSVPADAVVQRTGAAQGPANAVAYGVWVALAPATETGKVMYTCPMHPEVREDHVGKCPKCGMDLVPEKATGTKTAHFVGVTTGISDGKRTQIVTGLADGAEVIVRGFLYLREGDPISPVAWDATGPAELPAPPAAPAGAPAGTPADQTPGMKM